MAIVLLVGAIVASLYCYLLRRKSQRLAGKAQVDMQYNALFAALSAVALAILAIVADPVVGFVGIIAIVMLAVIALNQLRLRARQAGPARRQ